MKIHKMKTFSIVFCGIFSVMFSANIYGQNMYRKMLDFDGDGKADFAVTRNIGGQKIWYILQSTNGFAATQFGIDIDENMAGDYDGDGKFDVGIFRKESLSSSSTKYSFWVLRSQVGLWGYIANNNNFPTSAAHQQDYDGDGKTDVAVTWQNGQQLFVMFPSNGGTIPYPTAGGELIKAGDLTGDNRADIVGFIPNTNTVRIKNIANNAVQDKIFGEAGDVFFPADFDGDGRGDISIWRASTGMWWYMKSSDNTVQGTNWGVSGDVPVPADYDGDGKTDVAIWRGGAQSYYWVNGSQNGIFSVPWGIASDSVVKY